MFLAQISIFWNPLHCSESKSVGFIASSSANCTIDLMSTHLVDLISYKLRISQGPRLQAAMLFSSLHENLCTQLSVILSSPLSSSSSPPLPPPSLPLCSHYESTMGGRRVIWRLSDKTLETFSNSEVRMKVRVLGEELAYNKSLRQFKMFILEQPLDPNYKVGVWGNIQCFNVCIVRRCVHSTRMG